MTDLKDHAVLATVTAVGAAFALLGKWLDHVFGWRRAREDFAARLRDELHEEIEKLRAELEKVRAQAEEWREKYLREKELTGSLRNELAASMNENRVMSRRLEEEGLTE